MSDTPQRHPDQSASTDASGRSNDTAQSTLQNSDEHSCHSHQHAHNDDDDEDDDDENETFETDEGEVFEEDTDNDDDDDDDDDDPSNPVDMQDAIEGHSDDDGEDDDDDDEVDHDTEELVLVVDEQTGLRRAASLTRSDPRHPDSAATAAAIARSSSPLARRLQRQHVRMTTPRVINSNTTAAARGRSTVVAQGSSLQGSSSLAAISSSPSSSSAAATATVAGSQTGSLVDRQGASSSTEAVRSSTTTTGSTAGSTSTSATRPVTVPIIDEKAQSELRRKIMDIQRDPTISFAEKAAMIQRLMSSKWQESKKQDTGKDDETNDGSSTASAADLKTTYYNEEEKIMGCKHYSRGCKLKANCCGKWFNCRFCHDDVCDHAIVRTDTKYMLCMHCKSTQPAAQNCKDCNKQMARYYCNVCKLWDDDSKKNIYHCDDCGICRIGRGLGQDYFHCKKCNVCMAIALQNNHKCIERNLECDCPICGEYMFTSTSTVIFMPCGHCIHSKCHDAYIRTSYQCPTCWKALADMSEYYAKVDQLMEQQPMPAEYASYYSIVLCNDCEVKTETAFHFLYHKCGQCKGYNTKVLQTFQRVANGQDKVVLENAGEGASSGSGSSQQNNSQRGIGGESGNGVENVDVGGNSAGPASVVVPVRGVVGSSAAAAPSISQASSSAAGGGSSSTVRLLPGMRRSRSPGSMETNNDGGSESLTGRRPSNTFRP
ncbi:hypothetical protein DFQ27_007073 [Actinomortierella ambigua]|uniref:Zf-CHY-domain-containing protein n=1 Tax=Actinomortierella ambigua TaxID=1343610 RepID=A0A9P6TZL9_9FUNG|nr:hypothetical protein DFQ27_007073 [Actinomortierella ambigua]